MTSTDDETPTLPAPAKPAPGTHPLLREILFFAAITILITGVLTAGFRLLPIGRHGMAATGGTIASLQQELATLENKTQTLDTEISDLGTRVDRLEAASAPSSPANASQAPKIPAADIAHMQGDLTMLAATVGGLQAEVKQIGGTAAAARAKAETSLAETVAFMQLREAARSGRDFTRELAAMRMATKSDGDFEELLGRLTPFAKKGGPSLPVLREQLAEQSAAAEQAIAKAAAQNWWERVLAELRGLVSIRPLHGAAADTVLATMESELAEDNLAGALDDMKTLPSDAQKTLADWRQEAEARQAIDQALRAMADHLTAGANTVLPAPAQDTP